MIYIKLTKPTGRPTTLPKLKKPIFHMQIVYKYLEKVKTIYLENGGELNYISPYIDECIFGYSEIRGYLSKNDSILEIGCGGGLLSALLWHQGYKITGIEPHIKGFEKLELVLDTIKYIDGESFTLMRNTIEDLNTNHKFDLIFSINVFEHLDDFNYCIKNQCNYSNQAGKCY